MRKRYHGDNSSLTFANAIEEELYTRVFWLFVCSDAMISAFLGRPRVTRDDECVYSLCAVYDLTRLLPSYDIDYPVECDDEYWDHPDPEKRFQQPEGKPSVAAFIVTYLKLTEILGTAQKTIVSCLYHSRIVLMGYPPSIPPNARIGVQNGVRRPLRN
jgi:hypothetical protein